MGNRDRTESPTTQPKGLRVTDPVKVSQPPLSDDEVAWRLIKDTTGLYVHQVGYHHYRGPDKWAPQSCALRLHPLCYEEPA